MSIPLPTINLASVSVGQSGVINLTQVGISAGGISADPSLTKGAGTLHIFNESGSGLLFTFQTSGDGFYIPAGGWTDKQIRPGEQGLRWTVLYNLPNPPVTLLLVTYYAPYEPMPNVPTLGNSPIGIGGTVVTSSVQTLSNENSSPGSVLVIDIGNTTIPQMIRIFNDGSFVYSILIGGVAHQLLLGQNAFHSLVLGNATDVVEVVNQLSVDGSIVLNGSLNLTTGSITRIAHVLMVPCINGKTTVNHGLGAVPDVVLITINSASAGSTASAGYNPLTLSSTQVDIWGNGAFNADVTVIKF